MVCYPIGYVGLLVAAGVSCLVGGWFVAKSKGKTDKRRAEGAQKRRNPQRGHRTGQRAGAQHATRNRRAQRANPEPSET